MYKLCKYNTYNHRAFSTVAIENFFGDIQAMEFSGLGCLKATVIHKLMAHVMQLTKHQLDPDRYLYYLPSTMLHHLQIVNGVT